MSNVFQTAKEIHVRYDIKGSLYNRLTTEKFFYIKQLILFFNFTNSDPTIAKKDINALQDKFHLNLNELQAEKFLAQIKSDAKFFEENGIIDYSLLIGVHHHTKINKDDSFNLANLNESFFSDNFGNVIQNLFKYLN